MDEKQPTQSEIEYRQQLLARLPVIPSRDATCLRCGFTWEPRVNNPAQCPRCKRQDWNEAPRCRECGVRIHNENQRDAHEDLHRNERCKTAYESEIRGIERSLGAAEKRARKAATWLDKMAVMKAKAEADLATAEAARAEHTAALEQARALLATAEERIEYYTVSVISRDIFAGEEPKYE